MILKSHSFDFAGPDCRAADFSALANEKVTYKQRLCFDFEAIEMHSVDLTQVDAIPEDIRRAQKRVLRVATSSGWCYRFSRTNFKQITYRRH